MAMWCKDTRDNFPSFPSMPKKRFQHSKCKFLSLNFAVAQPSFKQLHNHRKDLN